MFVNVKMNIITNPVLMHFKVNFSLYLMKATLAGVLLGVRCLFF